MIVNLDVLGLHPLGAIHLFLARQGPFTCEDADEGRSVRCLGTMASMWQAVIDRIMDKDINEHVHHELKCTPLQRTTWNPNYWVVEENRLPRINSQVLWDRLWGSQDTCLVPCVRCSAESIPAPTNRR